MSGLKAVIIDERYESHEPERRELSAVGAEVAELTDPAPSPARILEVARDADAIVVNLAPIDAGVINGLERCRVIARYGVGVDNVDVEAATAKGILVVNVPDYCTEEVSDQALALLLACVRQVRVRDAAVRAGRWDVSEQGPMHRIAGRTMGLVGYGHIPRVLHRKLAGFNLARVLVYDPYVAESVVRTAGAQQVDFRTLLAESDYISIHAPLTGATRHMFDASAFSQMKRGVIVVNTSRGGLVDTTALTEALREGRVSWAGLDVHEQEPVPPDYPLLEMERVVLSDHRGFYSEESQAELQQKAARYAARVLAGETPESVVNPELLA